MADEFFKETTETTETPVEKIKLGDKEYTQSELQDLVGIGEKTREIETNLNTKIDRVYPEYTKATQKNREYEAKIKDYETKTATPQLDEESIRQAKEAAKKIGIVTDDGIAEFVSKNFRQMYMQERAAEKLLDDCRDFEKDMDGTDGRPKFKTEEILQYMQETGIRNPEKAYKDKYEKEVDSWKEGKLGQARKSGMVTETGSTAGGKEPTKVPVTRDNLDQLIKEALGQGE